MRPEPLEAVKGGWRKRQRGPAGGATAPVMVMVAGGLCALFVLAATSVALLSRPRAPLPLHGARLTEHRVAGSRYVPTLYGGVSAMAPLAGVGSSELDEDVAPAQLLRAVRRDADSLGAPVGSEAPDALEDRDTGAAVAAVDADADADVSRSRPDLSGSAAETLGSSSQQQGEDLVEVASGSAGDEDAVADPALAEPRGARRASEAADIRWGRSHLLVQGDGAKRVAAVAARAPMATRDSVRNFNSLSSTFDYTRRDTRYEPERIPAAALKAAGVGTLLSLFTVRSEAVAVYPRPVSVVHLLRGVGRSPAVRQKVDQTGDEKGDDALMEELDSTLLDYERRAELSAKVGTEISRIVRRGEFVVGYNEIELAERGGELVTLQQRTSEGEGEREEQGEEVVVSRWLQVGPSEFVPIKTRTAGFRWQVKHMSKLSSIEAGWFLNDRPLIPGVRSCALMKDAAARGMCWRFAYSTKEARRLVGALGFFTRVLPAVQRTGAPLAELKPGSPAYNHAVEKVEAAQAGLQPVPGSERLSFDERMRLFLPRLSEAEVCEQQDWTRCTLVRFCTWTFNVASGAGECLHRDLQEQEPRLRKWDGFLDTYNTSLDLTRVERGGADGERFFLFQPSGGMNNQRIILEIALAICLITNRTCVLPHAAQHTNYPLRYNLHTVDRMLSFQRIFDMDKLREAGVRVRTIPEEQTLLEFVRQNGGEAALEAAMRGESREAFLAGPASAAEKEWLTVNRDARLMTSRHVWGQSDIKQRFAAEPARFVFFAGMTMWKTIALGIFTDEFKAVRDALAFAPHIKRVALRLADQLGKYNAIHVRRGDKLNEGNFLMLVRDPEVYGQRLMRYTDVGPTLYVATDEPDTAYFQPLRDQGYKLVTWRDLDPALLGGFLARFPRQMFFDMLGTVEQSLCALANRFLGSNYSTFTMFILRLRRLLPMLGPLEERPKLGGPVLRKLLPWRMKGMTLEDPPTTCPLPDGTPCWNYTSTCNPFDPADNKAPC
jgi:hypothetical protein